MMAMGNTHEELPQQSSRSTVMLQYNSKLWSPLSYLEAVSRELWQRGTEQKYPFFRVMTFSQQTDSELP